MSRSKLELLQFIEAQRADYRCTLPEKVARIEALWQDVRQADEAQDKLGVLERMAHNLHGTAGTYGFRDLSHASHALELAVRALLDTGAPPTGAQQQQQQIAETINRVRLSLPSESSQG